jgi:hypothetical protein
MKKSRVSQVDRIATTSFGRAGFENVEVQLKPKDTAGNIGRKVNPPPSMQPVSDRFPALEEQEIVLTFLAPEARDVNVAGNFNSWQPDATPMKKTSAGKWVVRLMLKSGQYEYRFVVDGRWIEDPQAVQRVANPYGGFNSVFLVPLAVRTDIL